MAERKRHFLMDIWYGMVVAFIISIRGTSLREVALATPIVGIRLGQLLTIQLSLKLNDHPLN